MFMKKSIERPGDLAPKGIRSTCKGAFSFDETFHHIFIQILKPNKEHGNTEHNQ